MSKHRVFQQLINDFIQRPLADVRRRDLPLPLDLPKIISLLGPRRSGKTYLLFDVARQLRQQMASSRIVYLNFEDDRLIPLSVADLNDLVEGYYALFPDHRDETVYFLLDEVQVVEQWEVFVRRLSDQENCRIYLTGSSSKLLSRELATALRGRTLPFEVFPLSFAEFLRFRGVEVNLPSSQGTATLQHELAQYLKQGGFPELIFLPEIYHERTIREYIDLMIYRDLVERFNLRNPALIKYLLKHFLKNLASPLSFQKVYRDLRAQGYTIAKNTVYEYFSYLEEAFVLFAVQRWSTSVRQQAINPVKIYGIDPAFKRIMSIGEDQGRLLENLVYLHLRRTEQQVHYWLGKQEVDFLAEGQLINVCLELDNPETRQREVAGLWEGMEAMDLPEATLLTWHQRETIEQPGKRIQVIPVAEWLLA
jgi:uncharacterized protein